MTEEVENVSLEQSNINPETNIPEEKTIPPAEEDNITIVLLSNIKNLIEVAISRGAYRPNEISTVGKIYDNYVIGLNKLTTQNQLSNVEAN